MNYNKNKLWISKYMEDNDIIFITHNKLKNKLDMKIYNSDDEYKFWKKIGDEVLHINLMNWADQLIILDFKYSIGYKLLNGLCDDLLSLIIRAWPYNKNKISKNIIIYSPNKNFKYLKKLKNLGYIIK